MNRWKLAMVGRKKLAVPLARSVMPVPPISPESATWSGAPLEVAASAQGDPVHVLEFLDKAGDPPLPGSK